MYFVKLNKPYRGQIDEVLLRADLILEVGTRRHKAKDNDYLPLNGTEPPPTPGDPIGAWILVDRLGWTPVIETPDEILQALAEAAAAHQARLEAVRAKRDTAPLP
jgi:hypothetical protein